MKLHIAIPAYQRKVDIGVLASICSLTDDITLDYEDRSIISAARNSLVRRFLQTDNEWLLFWDSDTVPSVGFLSLMTETAEKFDAIVSAPCRIKGEPNLNCGFVRNNRVELFTSLREPRLVDVAGTGLMLIHRNYLQRIADPWFGVIENQGGVVLGEDFNFCLKARELGINIAVDSRVATTHYGVGGWQYECSKTIAA